ncbi:MAG: ribonuclease Z [Patescibacteria group bacterium]|nr:ribonuclease Z [Patescibacteria group bacterium]
MAKIEEAKQMKLTILGSGTYQPELKRHSSAYLLEVGKEKICFDFGRGATDQLLKLDIRITEIDALFISHWHGDHVADLIALLHYTTAPLSNDVSLLRPIRTKPLKIYGPKGTVENIRAFLNIIRYGKNELANLEVEELSEDEIGSNHWTVHSYLTDHKPNALCFRLEAENKIFAYSGDTLESEGLKKAIKNANLAIIEAGWPEEINPKTHMTGQKAGRIAQEQNVEKLILTHMSPLYLKNFDPAQDAQKHFRGEIILAKDLMKFEI